MLHGIRRVAERLTVFHNKGHIYAPTKYHILFEELEDWEGLNFDLIISLSPEANHKALELTRTLAADVEYWPTQDPAGTEGSREQKLAAYREVCDGLLQRIRRRFTRSGAISG